VIKSSGAVPGAALSFSRFGQKIIKPRLSIVNKGNVI
jgi:hypothetical protein